MARSANITASMVKKIVDIIDAWSSEKLTWDLLVEEIARQGHPGYTRQALERRESIKTAFTSKKTGLREARLKSTQQAKTLPQALAVIEKLTRALSQAETERARLALTNDNLIAQFMRWATNAINLGISQEVLDTPLHPMNRAKSRSDGKKEKIPRRVTIVTVERPDDTGGESQQSRRPGK